MKIRPANKFKRVAVILKGQLRTWDYTKHNIFETYNLYANHIDWYITCPNYYSLETLNSLKNDFSDKNLVNIKLCDPPIKLSTLKDEYWTYQWNAWLAIKFYLYSIIPYIKTDIEYDAIIEQRLDCFLYLKPNYLKKVILKDNTVYSSSVGLTFNDRTSMCNQKTFYNFIKRFELREDIAKKFDYSESWAMKYCIDNNIALNYDDSPIHCDAIRPYIFTKHKKLPHFLFIDKINLCNWYNYQWEEILTDEEKLNICSNLNINYLDYIDRNKVQFLAKK